MKMKKLIISVFLLTLLCSLFAGPAMAATKSDVLGDFKNSIVSNHIDISPDNETMRSLYITYMAENAIRNMPMTPAQGDLFVTWIQECAAYVNINNGPSAHSYTPAERAYVIERIGRVAQELNLRYAFETKSAPLHRGDVVFSVYDRATSQLVFQYDGDVVKKTDAAVGESKAASDFYHIALPIIAISALFALSFVAARFVSRKMKVRTSPVAVPVEG